MSTAKAGLGQRFAWVGISVLVGQDDPSEVTERLEWLASVVRGDGSWRMKRGDNAAERGREGVCDPLNKCIRTKVKNL